MIYRLEFLPGAMLDIEESFLWYQVISPRLRDRFEDQLHASLKEINSNPFAWHFVNPKARCKKFKRFPYLIIFAVQKDFITVVAVIHERRNPTTWKRRLRKK
jgi:plasmid stabilization system protein ParE